MSTYSKLTKNPKTGEFEYATWMDDYFGRHHYGVKFPDGEVIDPEKVELETMDMPNNPSSNEDWMIKFYEQFGANKIWVTPSRDNVQTIFEIENFIRQQRLGAQRELTEEIINYMEDGLDEPTDWYVSVKNFLSSRGLLPKITE